MPKKITTNNHVWVAAASVTLSDIEARIARTRGHVDIQASQRVTVLETYCEECRRPYDDVADETCVVAVEGNEHLRGGPVGTRKKRGVISPGYDIGAEFVGGDDRIVV